MSSLKDYISVFNNSIPSDLQLIIKTLLAHNKKVYIVGGAVRDCLLGFPVKDFDIATNAKPTQIEELLNKAGIKTKPFGSRYGTVLAIVGKKAFHLSTFRQEQYSASNELSEVFFVDSLEEDLARRDFGINAIAFDPKEQKFIDKYEGFRDIQQKKISMIGDASRRLKEDGLRIIRLARFSSQFNLTIGQDLLSVISAIGKNASFRTQEALQKEFFKLLMLPDPQKGLHLLWDAEILSAIFPKIPFLRIGAEDVKSERILEKYNEIPSRNILVRLFGLLIFLSDKSSHSRDIWGFAGYDLGVSDMKQQKLDRIYQSWLDFPQAFDSRKLKRWIKSTGIKTSEDLIQLIFLYAELVEESELLMQRDQYLKESILILKNLYGEKSGV